MTITKNNMPYWLAMRLMGAIETEGLNADNATPLRVLSCVGSVPSHGDHDPVAILNECVEWVKAGEYLTVTHEGTIPFAWH